MHSPAALPGGAQLRHRRVHAPRASSGIRDAGMGTVFCCAMDPPTECHCRMSPGGYCGPILSIVARPTHSKMRPSVDPQCYGPAMPCQPAPDLPFRVSPQVRNGFRRGRTTVNSGRYGGLLRHPGAPAVRRGGTLLSRVPARSARSGGTADRNRCQGPEAGVSAPSDRCSRTGPFRRPPGP